MADFERARLVRTNRTVRSAAFAYCVLPIGLYLWEHEAGAIAWALLAAQFLVYPQLVYWRALRSARPTRAELDNLFLDAVLLGAWIAYLGFPTWIAYALLAAATLNAAVNRGAEGALLALGCAGAGAALWVLIGGWHYTPETSHWVTSLAATGSMAYLSAVGVVVWTQNRHLTGTRDALRTSEDRYRLIAENADDLVAMVDPEGRWLYTSPSYRKVFKDAELERGADGYQRIHPDDAERVRMAIARAAATGKARELSLRLVDRDGRARQYHTRLQPLADSSAPHRVIIVSHDVTDLRESEEKMLLAAHALEGMTEAIMITAADGTIVTVNRAFCDITGRSREEVLGQLEKEVRGGMQPPEFYDEVYATVQRDGYWSGTHWSRRKNGAVFRQWRSVRAIKDASGAITHYVHVFSEVGAPRAGGASTATPA